MYCKVCKDAGKKVEEYESHNIRDKFGKTVCPTLLSQKCNYCKEPGHTVKYCQKVKLKNKIKRREDYFKKEKEDIKENENKTSGCFKKSTFAEAFSSSDSENECENENESCIETVDIDLNVTVPISTNYIRSYVNVLKDEPSPHKKEPKEKKINEKKKLWGDDDSDSDSDEE